MIDRLVSKEKIRQGERVISLHVNVSFVCV